MVWVWLFLRIGRFSIGQIENPLGGSRFLAKIRFLAVPNRPCRRQRMISSRRNRLFAFLVGRLFLCSHNDYSGWALHLRKVWLRRQLGHWFLFVSARADARRIINIMNMVRIVPKRGLCVGRSLEGRPRITFVYAQSILCETLHTASLSLFLSFYIFPISGEANVPAKK